MGFDFFKLFKIISVVSEWMKKSLEDGKIDLKEALTLIKELAVVLDLPLGFDMEVFLGRKEEEAAKPPDGDEAAEDKEIPII